MWLMTKIGFYSVVKRDEEIYHVRARIKKDLENLLALESLETADLSIEENHSADYHYRVRMDKNRYTKMMVEITELVDYGNFKSEIAMTPDQEDKPYDEIWSILADRYGAY